MALGLGEGGEQNAPLGRAVIGGLVFATVSTLFFVPVVFSIIHRQDGPKPVPQATFGGADVPHDRNPGRPTPRRLRQFGIAFLLIAVAVVVFGLVSRAAQNSRLHESDRSPGGADGSRRDADLVENHQGLDLPGRLEAYIRAPIYARVRDTSRAGSTISAVA